MSTATLSPVARRNRKPIVSADSQASAIGADAIESAAPIADAIHKLAIDGGYVTPDPAKPGPAENAELGLQAERETAAIIISGNAPAESAPKMTPEEFLPTEREAIKGIVGQYVAMHQSESARSFSIGKDAYELAIGWRNVAPNYSHIDFESMVLRIRTEVRLFVAIKPESIKVSDWVKAYRVRENVRELFGDTLAYSLTISEAIILHPSAQRFDKDTLENSLSREWLDFFTDLKAKRSANHAATVGAKFEGMVQAHKDKLAELAKSKQTDEQRQKSAAAAAGRAAAKRINEANEAITTSLTDALSNNVLPATGVMAIVETVFDACGVDMPCVGFDPATATADECRTLAGTMYALGRYTEMVALYKRLGRYIAEMDKARVKLDAERATHEVKVDPSAERLSA